MAEKVLKVMLFDDPAQTAGRRPLTAVPAECWY